MMFHEKQQAIRDRLAGMGDQEFKETYRRILALARKRGFQYIGEEGTRAAWAIGQVLFEEPEYVVFYNTAYADADLGHHGQCAIRSRGEYWNATGDTTLGDLEMGALYVGGLTQLGAYEGFAYDEYCDDVTQESFSHRDFNPDFFDGAVDQDTMRDLLADAAIDVFAMPDGPEDPFALREHESPRY